MSQVKCRILYVDDHEDSSMMLKLLLAQSDYEVHSAATMSEAIRMAQTGEFDLYILDKRLPDGSGIELVRRLNQISPGTPSIFYTGDAYQIHREEALAAGANAYIPKPEIEALIDAVHQLLMTRECAAA